MTKSELREENKKLPNTIFTEDHTHYLNKDLMCKHCGGAIYEACVGDMMTSHVCSSCGVLYSSEYIEKDREYHYEFLVPDDNWKIVITVYGRDFLKKHDIPILNKLNRFKIYSWDADEIRKLFFDFKIIEDSKTDNYLLIERSEYGKDASV